MQVNSTMPIQLKCVCGKTLIVPDSAAGKKARCPKCKALNDVPDEEEAAVEMIEEDEEVEERREPKPPAPAPPQAGGATMPCVVLIVNDPDLALTVMDMLRKENYRLEWARTAPDGLQMVGRYKPDVVVVDTVLPEGDGFQVAEAIRGSRGAPADAPAIVMLTPRVNDDAEAKATAAGFEGTMRKPLYPAALCQMVVEIMDERRD